VADGYAGVGAKDEALVIGLEEHDVGVAEGCAGDFDEELVG
jgi:hypothetical protein